jgi:hypothetical protein
VRQRNPTAEYILSEARQIDSLRSQFRRTPPELGAEALYAERKFNSDLFAYSDALSTLCRHERRERRQRILIII